jgi:hypothetical protein
MAGKSGARCRVREPITNGTYGYTIRSGKERFARRSPASRFETAATTLGSVDQFEVGPKPACGRLLAGSRLVFSNVFAPAGTRAQVRRKSCGARSLMPARFAAAFTMWQIALGVILSPTNSNPTDLRARRSGHHRWQPPLSTRRRRVSPTREPGLSGCVFLCRSGQRLPNAPRETGDLPFGVQPVQLVVVRIR